MHDVSIAVLYPYPGLPKIDRGTARRVVPLLSLLKETYTNVSVLSPGSVNFQQEGINYFAIPEGKLGREFNNIIFKLYDGLTYHLLGRLDIRRRRQWWNFIRPRLQFSLRHAIQEVCKNTDIILLEYPFWSDVVAGIPMLKSKPVILTLHDLLSEIGEHPWLSTRVRLREERAARRAQAVVCVTEKEAQTISRQNTYTEYIPHGFVISHIEKLTNTEPDNPSIVEIRQRVAAGDMLCMFLGSSLAPNRVAAESVTKIARACACNSRLVFVIAGTCSGPGKPASNVYSLGSISEKDLDILYDLCSISLCPVTSGTGASLKVLEAMSRKKTLLSTQVGVRGYNGIMNGEQAIISNNLEEWPKILERLVQNDSLQQKLATQGYTFALQFDYQKVYAPYLDIINRLLKINT